MNKSNKPSSTVPVVEEFRVHMNGVRCLFPPNDGSDTAIAYFGYKTRRGDEVFTVTDWGNVEKFLTQKIREAKLEVLKEKIKTIEGMVSYSEESGWKGIVDGQKVLEVLKKSNQKGSRRGEK